MLSLVLYPFPKQSNGLFLLRTLIRERKTCNIQEKLAPQTFLVKNYNMTPEYATLFLEGSMQTWVDAEDSLELW